MAVQIDVGRDRIEGLDLVRERLGDTGHVRRDVAGVLNQAARIGAQSARIYAPKGATRRLTDAITDDTIQFTATAGWITATFGVVPVENVASGLIGRERGSAIYPVFVHEGTGIYGRIGRIITPRRRSVMTFVGRTGFVRVRSVKGQRPQPYVREAYEDARAYVDAHLDDMLGRIIE